MSSLFNVRKQLTFYGAYHSNKANIAIHLVGVPMILWSALVWLSTVPMPEALSVLDFKPVYISKYLSFEPTSACLLVAIYQAYYTTLEPVAGLLYLPEFFFSLGTANAFSHRPDGLKIAAMVHVAAWISQFVGHGVFEGRAPALLDNFLGAVVLAPFFVHLEILFALGYRKQFHKELNNSIGVEITKVRKADAEKKRAAERKAA